MSDNEETTEEPSKKDVLSRRDVLRYGGIAGAAGLGGVGGISLQSRPAAAAEIDIADAVPVEGNFEVPAYDVTYSGLNTEYDIRFIYKFEETSGTRAETTTKREDISDADATVNAGPHTVKVPGGDDVKLTVSIYHPSGGLLTRDSSNPRDIPTTVRQIDLVSGSGTTSVDELRFNDSGTTFETQTLKL